LLLFAAPVLARAYDFVPGYDTAPTLAQALERVKADPKRHVLLYFDDSAFCAPCKEARAVLTSDAVRQQWRNNYVVVAIDLVNPSKDEREVIDQLGVRWAPLLVFLDGTGRRVAYTRNLRNAADALVLNDFVAQRQYALSPLGKYTAQAFDYRAGSQMAISGLVVAGEKEPIDDRPRLRDVLALKPERLKGAELQKTLAGKVMHKENQEWFLTLVLGPNKAMPASGKRKDGRGDMKGAGKWYVTKKGKLCLELTAGGVAENWCRHVFRVGEGYYVSKDLRPDRVVYRFVLENS
jgi:thiol-disulfide isomerase/thioredoxin